MFTSFNARAVGLFELSAEETVDLAAAAGYDGVDLLVRDLVRSGLEQAAIVAAPSSVALSFSTAAIDATKIAGCEITCLGFG